MAIWASYREFWRMKSFFFFGEVGEGEEGKGERMERWSKGGGNEEGMRRKGGGKEEERRRKGVEEGLTILVNLRHVLFW